MAPYKFPAYEFDATGRKQLYYDDNNHLTEAAYRLYVKDLMEVILNA